MKKSSLFIFVLLFVVSCLDDPDCYLLNNDKIGIAFRVLGSSALDSAVIRSISVDGNNYVRKTGGDTLIATIELGLNYFNEATSVGFVGRDGSRFIDLGYSRQVQFVSENCGPRYLLSNLRVLSTNFDTISVVSTSPSRSGGRHLEIFRCSAPDSIAIEFRDLFYPVATNPSNSSRAAGVDFTSIEWKEGEALFGTRRAATVKLPVDFETPESNYTFNIANGFGGTTPTRKLGLNYVISDPDTRFPTRCEPRKNVSNITLETAAIPKEDRFDSVSFARDANNVAIRTLLDPIRTTLYVYRCPQTNLMQVSFRTRTSPTATPIEEVVKINRITLDYTNEVFYTDVEVRTVVIPLNIDADQTTMTIEYANRIETITVRYTRAQQRLYQNTCGITTIITNLTAEGGDNLRVVQANLQFPAVTNLHIIRQQ